ncbi:hypothetical protein NIA71_03475 [Ihubacter massiliensis]|uniref:Uncharacterized protein n=1 Tax=Hominibacterium faecale TaxID=2839743 RepID=A0A9J6QPZ4_9FIRM|nr:MULTISPECIES: hypothetical protein [Eubacteriales Family XIII. Incertae Sedis]MCO7121009.1 hypothetical protein [Ihubacter massiliensis]MCU7377925.1 hypothetical protein [Hominibacterium faecale]
MFEITGVSYLDAIHIQRSGGRPAAHAPLCIFEKDDGFPFFIMRLFAVF